MLGDAGKPVFECSSTWVKNACGFMLEWDGLGRSLARGGGGWKVDARSIVDEDHCTRKRLCNCDVRSWRRGSALNALNGAWHYGVCIGSMKKKWIKIIDKYIYRWLNYNDNLTYIFTFFYPFLCRSLCCCFCCFTLEAMHWSFASGGAIVTICLLPMRTKSLCIALGNLYKRLILPLRAGLVV